MPDRGRGRVHRFRDHAVAGVNWRPTRFVDEVPNSRVCGLCRMIPKRTVLLPCSHALCQSCHAASIEEGVGHCPLDQVQFEEAECVGHELPTMTANTLKVHCWNEAHGCEYTGTMDRVLEHYENECIFHAVECLRCGVGVQHRDLPTHYVAGCAAGVSPGIAADPSSEPAVVNLEGLGSALEDLKAMLGDPNHDQLLPVIQSQLNELTEQARKQDARFAEITREVGASESNLKSQMAQIVATITSTLSQQLTSRQDPAEEPRTSSLSWRSEKAMILRKLEHLAERSGDVLEHLRQTSPQPDSDRVIARCKPLNGDIRHLSSALSTTAARIRAIGSVIYDLTLENCEEIIQMEKWNRKIAQVTMWHMRDTFFKIQVSTGRATPYPPLYLLIEFSGTLEESRCLPPIWHVRVMGDEGESLPLSSCRRRCSCKHDEDRFVHFHLLFGVGGSHLKNNGFFRDGKLRFRIVLADNDMGGGLEGTP